MRISVQLDENGMLPDAYGKFAARPDQRGRLCVRSFPFGVSDIPEGTAALAWVFMDWDSIPVCGFPWVHWCAQLDGVAGARSLTVADDASRGGSAAACPDLPGATLAQGYNSAAKSDPATGVGYVGPCPPNCDHVYTLHVVALDKACDLGEGRNGDGNGGEPFWANELVAACRGHVLAEAVAQLPSRA